MVVKSSVNKYLDVNKFWKAAEGKGRGEAGQRKLKIDNLWVVWSRPLLVM